VKSLSSAMTTGKEEIDHFLEKAKRRHVRSRAFTVLRQRDPVRIPGSRLLDQQIRGNGIGRRVGKQAGPAAITTLDPSLRPDPV
jgi:hypothetical protein